MSISTADMDESNARQIEKHWHDVGQRLNATPTDLQMSHEHDQERLDEIEARAARRRQS